MPSIEGKKLITRSLQTEKNTQGKEEQSFTPAESTTGEKGENKNTDGENLRGAIYTGPEVAIQGGNNLAAP